MYIKGKKKKEIKKDCIIFNNKNNKCIFSYVFFIYKNSRIRRIANITYFLNGILHNFYKIILQKLGLIRMCKLSCFEISLYT